MDIPRNLWPYMGSTEYIPPNPFLYKALILIYLFRFHSEAAPVPRLRNIGCRSQFPKTAVHGGLLCRLRFTQTADPKKRPWGYGVKVKGITTPNKT